MPEGPIDRKQVMFWIHGVVQCLRKDWKVVLAAGVLLAALGGAMGKLNQTAESTAQLLYAPPAAFRSSDDKTDKDKKVYESDKMDKMLSAPIDIKTIGLLCSSDDTYQKTLDKLNASGKFSQPLKLKTLSDSLRYRITIAKETPYDLVYSPIIELTAEAKTAAQAQLMANEWAKQCVEAGSKYQSMFYTPSEEVMAVQLGKTYITFQTDQQEYAEFQKKEILDFYKARIDTVIASISALEQSKTDVMQNIVRAKAEAESTQLALNGENQKLNLKWKSPNKTLKQLASTVGLKPQVSDEKAEPNTDGLLDIEQLNENYITLRGDLANAQIAFASEQANYDELDKLIAQRRVELDDLQGKMVLAKIQDAFLKDKVTVSGDAYMNMLGRAEFSGIALELAKVPHLQLFSQGAEWQVPRFRGAIMFGFVMGALGCAAAALISCLFRLVVKPMLDAA